MNKLSRNIKNHHRHGTGYLWLCIMLMSVVITAVCLPRGFLYAASKKTNVKSGQTTILRQLEQLTGTAFSIENIQKTGIEDLAFVQAVYHSVVSDPNNFRTGMRVDSHGKTTNDGTTLTASEIMEKGKKEGVQGISLILSYFTGTIEAEKKGIRSIKGIKNLRRAKIINLRNNEIQDVTELRMNENQIGNETDQTMYFGEPNRNVLIWLRGNSISHFCQWMNGRLLLDMDATEWTVYKPTFIIKRLTEKDYLSGITTGNIPVSFLCDGQPVILNKSGIKKYDSKSTIKKYEIVDNSSGKALSRVQFSNIRQSGMLAVTFSSYQMWGMYTADFSGNDNISMNATSLKGEKTVQVELYTDMIGDIETSGSIRLHKTDDAGKSIKGAIFSLYKKENGKDHLIKEKMESDVDGNIFCSDLKAGDYYFIETSVPKGYVLDSEKKYEFTVTNGTMTLKNKARGSDFLQGDKLLTKDGSVTVNQHGEEIQNTKEEQIEKGIFVKGGERDQIDFHLNETETSRIERVAVSWDAGVTGQKQAGSMNYVIGDGEKTSTTIYCKNSEILEQNVKQKVEEASQDFYQNVKIKAIFGGNQADSSIKTLHAVNQRTYQLKVYKENSSEQPPEALENAEFTLYQESKDGDDEKKKTTIYVNGTPIDVTEVQKKLTKFEDDKATALFDDLRSSTRWYLEETKAPVGYQRMKTILTIDVTQDGIIKVEGKETKKVEGEENTFYLTISNQKNISLPHTGSRGTLFYKVAGCLLAIAAVVSSIILWKKRGKKG